MATKVHDKEPRDNDVLYGKTPPRETERDPTLAILPLERLRVSSGQSNAEGPSLAMGVARGDVYQPSRLEPAGELRHTELTSRY